MKNFLLFISFTFVNVQVYAQTIPTDTSYWSKGMEFSLNVNQSTFSDNWKGGGRSNISIGSFFNAKTAYKKENLSFDQILNLQYGLIKNKGEDSRKTTDLIFFDSKLGKNFSKEWSIFASINFVSQFDAGYTFKKDTNGVEIKNKISSILSPGYLTESVGLEYKPNKYFFARLGLGSTKQTFVLNQSLYNAIDTVKYGVPFGKKVTNELGFQFLSQYEREIFKNINFKLRYLSFLKYEKLTFANIDHRVDLAISSRINKYMSASFNLILVKDIDQDLLWQRSQMLGFGLLVKL